MQIMQYNSMYQTPMQENNCHRCLISTFVEKNEQHLIRLEL